MEGPWVGNWRPHPRRGPILAEFSTPGPKYGLPGLTGKPSMGKVVAAGGTVQCLLPLGNLLSPHSCRHRSFHRLFLPGHMAHDPTKDRAPAFSFRGSNAPSADTCSPGPRYFIESSITKTGRQVAPSALVTARPKTKILATPGPSDYTTDRANKHVFHTAPANSLASRHKDLKGFRTPGPGTYTLPRILGPNTAYTHAEPCYSMKGKSQYQSCFQDVAKTPGPAAFPKVDLDVYKTRAPKFSMGLKTKVPGKGALPGPAEYTLGKLSITKARDPAFSFGVRHSLYQASLIPETHVD
ncbi:LOW QUALITY PROTEIN: ciliary microtubule associated protein 1A-like [Passerculus sandwichensis]